jgi:hypothetical protein
MMQPSQSIEYIQLPNSYFSTYLPTGKRLVLLGESTQGELYNPIPISNVEIAKAVFGSGPLIDRLNDVAAGNSSGVYLMRIEPNAFQKAWGYLIKFPFDLIYNDGLTFSEAGSLISSFIAFAKEKEEMGQLIHGFFDAGSKEMDNLRELYIPIMKLSVPVEDGIEEQGKYLSVVADQMKEKKAAAVYAGFLSSLNPEISPVNKTLDVELATEYSNKEIDELGAAGIVCFKKTFKKGVVCATSSCAVSTPGSAHKHIANFRIAQWLIQEIAEKQDLLVGRVGYIPVLEDLRLIAASTIQSYIDLNRITSGTFEVYADGPYMRTDIEIVPIFSVYRMSSTVQVRVRR